MNNKILHLGIKKSLNIVEDSMRRGMCMYVWLGHSAVQQKLAQHCKSTIIKKKIFLETMFYGLVVAKREGE